MVLLCIVHVRHVYFFHYPSTGSTYSSQVALQYKLENNSNTYKTHIRRAGIAICSQYRHNVLNDHLLHRHLDHIFALYKPY